MDWEEIRVKAAIAAMPIADKIVDNLYSYNYHYDNSLHTIDRFVEECVGIADALVAKLKESNIETN